MYSNALNTCVYIYAYLGSMKKKRSERHTAHWSPL